MTESVENYLMTVWEEKLGSRPGTTHDSFFNLGGTSMLAVSMFAEVETHYQTELPLLTFLQAPTIDHLTQLIEDKDNAPSWPSLVPIVPVGTKPPFFCVHGGAGRVLYLYGLADHLPPDQPYFGLQPPPLTVNQLQQLRVPDLAAHYLQEVRKQQPHGPYYLGGLCFGGNVAFEMAQQLAQNGEEVAFLGLFDTALWTPNRFGTEYTAYEVRKFIARVKRRLTKGKRRQGKQKPAIKEENQVRAAIIKAVSQYEPEIYPGRITCFLGQDTRARYPSQDPRLGWQTLAQGGFTSYEVPGAEWQQFTEPNVQTLAQCLIGNLPGLRDLEGLSATEYLSTKNP